MLLNPFTFHSPKTLSEAVKLYDSLDNVKLLAGGTFLLNRLKMLKKRGIRTPEHVISLSGIDELTGISCVEGKIVIGAMTMIGEIFASSLLDENCAILKTVARHIGSTPIRNMATIGGNLTCRYTWTEMPALMIALDADMHFVDKDGQEIIIAAEEFFLKEAKTQNIFTRVSVPYDKSTFMVYHRVSKSQTMDIPLLTVCVKTNFQDAKFTNTKVVLNNHIAFAQRDKVLEDFLNQKSASKEVAEQALEHLDQPIYDMRSSDYKKHMFRLTIRKAIEELIEKR